jgi:hypothetical protein
MPKKLGIKKTTKVSTPMVLDVELKKLEGECTDRALQRRYRIASMRLTKTSREAYSTSSPCFLIVASSFCQPSVEA